MSHIDVSLPLFPSVKINKPLKRKLGEKGVAFCLRLLWVVDVHLSSQSLSPCPNLDTSHTGLGPTLMTSLNLVSKGTVYKIQSHCEIVRIDLLPKHLAHTQRVLKNTLFLVSTTHKYLLKNIHLREENEGEKHPSIASETP